MGSAHPHRVDINSRLLTQIVIFWEKYERDDLGGKGRKFPAGKTLGRWFRISERRLDLRPLDFGPRACFRREGFEDQGARGGHPPGCAVSTSTTHAHNMRGKRKTTLQCSWLRPTLKILKGVWFCKQFIANFMASL